MLSFLKLALVSLNLSLSQSAEFTKKALPYTADTACQCLLVDRGREVEDVKAS